jgi:predicted PurR-regulated permease PerM
MTRTRSGWTRYWPVGLALVIVGVLYLLAPVLTPFVTSSVLAYMLVPIVDWLARRGWPRALAVSVVMAGALLMLATLLVIIVPLFIRQLTALYGYLPNALAWLRDVVAPWAARQWGVMLAFDLEGARAWLMAHREALTAAVQTVLPSLKSGGLAVITTVTNALLLPVVLFYFLRDWSGMVAHVDRLTPRHWQGRLQQIAGEIDQVLGEFLRGQLSVMAIMALFYVLGLALVGLHSALPIGIIAGLLVFVPYLGVIVGGLLATLAAALQFQSVWGVLPVWAVFLAGQLVESFWVTPKLVGERIGLHPVAVIFALMAFGQLFGFVGVLLALPLAASMLVALRHLRGQYFESRFYRGARTRRRCG